MNKKMLLPAVVLLCCLLVGCNSDEPVLNFGADSTVEQYPTGGPAPTGGTRDTAPTQSTDATVPTDRQDPTVSTEPSENTEPTVDPGPWTHEAALTHLLEDTNHNGEYLPGDGAVAPGSNTPVELIPAAGQNRIGETVSIILAQRQQAIPFYYLCTAGGMERLAVFIDAKIPMLVVFETDLGGIQGLQSHIQAETVFQGTILSMTNLDSLEGSMYARGNCITTDDVGGHEILTDGTSLIEGECVGIVGTEEGGAPLTVIKGGLYETASDALKADIDWMKKVFRRYSLESVTSSEKLICQATLNDSFSDNLIMVIVYPHWNDKVYTPEDFAEIGCVALTVLMEPKPHAEPSYIMVLELDQHSKQNVLDCIRILDQRADIYCAEVNGADDPL